MTQLGVWKSVTESNVLLSVSLYLINIIKSKDSYKFRKLTLIYDLQAELDPCSLVQAREQQRRKVSSAVGEIGD